MSPNTSTPSGPWWKVGHMWLVVAGPLIVVVASFVTLWLAIRTPDPVYVDAPKAGARALTVAARDAGWRLWVRCVETDRRALLTSSIIECYGLVYRPATDASE